MNIVKNSILELDLQLTRLVLQTQELHSKVLVLGQVVEVLPTKTLAVELVMEDMELEVNLEAVAVAMMVRVLVKVILKYTIHTQLEIHHQDSAAGHHQ